VQAVQSAHAFERFYEQAHLRVFRYATLLCDTAADAEDITAETFLRAWRARASFHGDADAAIGWVITIARNLVADRRRAMARGVRCDVLDDAAHELIADPTSVEDLVLTEEQTGRALELVRGLPDQQRELIVLRYVLGWRVNQIAAHVGISDNLVSVTLKRALQRLQRELAPAGRPSTCRTTLPPCPRGDRSVQTPAGALAGRHGVGPDGDMAGWAGRESER
jgi:RNA polymerase sigma-70 factor (ECF subfamily)